MPILNTETTIVQIHTNGFKTYRITAFCKFGVPQYAIEWIARTPKYSIELKEYLNSFLTPNGNK